MKFSVIFVLCAISGNLAEDYCDRNLCRYFTGSIFVTRPHIGCPGVAVNKCSKDSLAITMDEEMQKFILDKHNSYRNALAGGNIKGFATASAMTEMQWDSELANLASLNAMQCVYAHDECHNTKIARYSGQNMGNSIGTHDNKVFINQMIDLWWNEYNQCTQDVLDSYHRM